MKLDDISYDLMIKLGKVIKEHRNSLRRNDCIKVDGNM